MAKYYGKIGYVKTVETAPSVWMEEAVERPYYGDVQRNTRRWQFQSEGVNDDILVNETISIVADPYAYQNYPYMKYCWRNGVAWKISDISVEYPRIVFNLGGVYNGETAKTGQGTPCPCGQ